MKYIDKKLRDLTDESLPVRGAWIEIRYRKYGKDGPIVAPRKGSVD